MFDVARWPHPFDRSGLGKFVSPDSMTACAGEILLVRLARDPSLVLPAASRVPELVADVRRRYPGNPVVLWLSGIPEQMLIDAVRAASTAQVRAILGGEDLELRLLRLQLTEPLGLSSFVLRWAADAGYLPQNTEQDDVRVLLDAAPGVRTLNRLSRERAIPARTWRSHLQHRGLPTPRAWLALSHALHAGLYLQRHAGQPVEVLARQLGMGSVANINQQFRRAFGLSAGCVRGLLGGEPLLEKWFQRRLART